MTLLVRDEEDILDTHLRYHFEQGVDFVVATDNRSSDSTPEILRVHESEGRLHYIHEATDDFNQSTWVTTMARMAADRFEADWVIHSDADEFWWSDYADLASALQSVPPEAGVISAPRVDFLPRPLSNEPVFARMTVRERKSFNTLGDPLPPKVCHRADPAVIVGHGNHKIHNTSLKPLDGPSPLTIFHFPLRSYRQFERKIVHGGKAYERNRTAPPGVGRTWRDLYEDWKAGLLPARYRARVADDAVVRHGIDGGTLLVDRRLADFLEDHEISLGG